MLPGPTIAVRWHVTVDAAKRIALVSNFLRRELTTNSGILNERGAGVDWIVGETVRFRTNESAIAGRMVVGIELRREEKMEKRENEDYHHSSG